MRNVVEEKKTIWWFTVQATTATWKLTPWSLQRCAARPDLSWSCAQVYLGIQSKRCPFIMFTLAISERFCRAFVSALGQVVTYKPFNYVRRIGLYLSVSKLEKFIKTSDLYVYWQWLPRNHNNIHKNDKVNVLYVKWLRPMRKNCWDIKEKLWWLKRHAKFMLKSLKHYEKSV